MRQEARIESRCDVVERNQAEYQKAPIHEGVRQPGQGPLLDHFAL